MAMAIYWRAAVAITQVAELRVAHYASLISLRFSVFLWLDSLKVVKDNAGIVNSSSNTIWPRSALNRRTCSTGWQAGQAGRSRRGKQGTQAAGRPAA